jgi:hypothetical protein
MTPTDTHRNQNMDSVQNDIDIMNQPLPLTAGESYNYTLFFKQRKCSDLWIIRRNGKK